MQKNPMVSGFLRNSTTIYKCYRTLSKGDTKKIFSSKRIKCKDEIKDILSNGFPTMVTQLLISLTGYVMNIVISHSGQMEAVTVMSVCTIALSLANIIGTSFVQAENSMMGILIGSEDWEVAKNLEKKVLLISTVTISIYVLVISLFPQVLFNFYGIKEYSDFQMISVRFYLIYSIPLILINNLSSMCVYCGKKRTVVITEITERILLIPVFYILISINPNLMFLCYFICKSVSVAVLSITTKKSFNKKINETKNTRGIHFSFNGSEANDVSQKLFEYLQKNDALLKDAYKLALVCEELGAYAANGENNGDNLHIFLAIKIYDDYIRVFYLDDSTPAIQNKKYKATDLVLGNYNLLESMSTEFTYQIVSGFNNFILKFDR